MTIGDALVIVLLVIAWSLSIVMFWRRWKRFSLLGPRVQDVYQKPKNLESVSVVRRPDDSVIYASYPKHVVTAIQVRRTSLRCTTLVLEALTTNLMTLPVVVVTRK